jgi:PAS domain S-box-containing protein
MRSIAKWTKVLGWTLLTLCTISATSTTPKRVLLLYSFGRGFAPTAIIDRAFRAELAQEFNEPIEFNEISLEMPRPGSEGSQEAAVAHVEAVFKRRRPDLVVSFVGPAARFALQRREQLFSGVPLLLAGPDARLLQSFTLDTNTTAVTASFDLALVINNLQQLKPGITNINVVVGNSWLESFWRAEMQRDFERLTNRIGFTYLNDLNIREIEERLGHLPPSSAIFYFCMLMDAAGVPCESTELVGRLRAVANAPMVGLFEDDVGRGVIGGRLVSLEQEGREAGCVATRILRGASPGTIHTPTFKPDRLVYDWRELRRWGIRESQLPAGSEVRFRPPSFVIQYRWHIAAAVGLCLGGLILALVRELQRRHMTERSLRESQERMKLAADSAELGIWEWNLLTDEIWATGPMVLRLYAGKTGAHNKGFLHSVYGEDRPEVVQALDKALKGDGDYESVHRALCPDGHVRWVAARGRVEFDVNRKPLRMRGVVMDITTRKEAEERALESERRFVLMANSAPVLIWASGLDKLCTFFNKPWLDFTGRSLEQELGNGWAEGVHIDDLAGCLKAYNESFDRRVAFTLEYRLRRRDGNYRWVSDHGVPRYDSGGDFVGYIGCCVDVTERREAESEAQRTRQEVAHLSRVSTLGQLAVSLAHELNQPLGSIMLNAQVAQQLLNSDHADLNEVREILNDIIKQDSRAAEVILRTRAMLRKGETLMAPARLDEVIQDALGLMTSELLLRKVTTTTHLARDLPLVRADRIQLQQVFVNLIVNACDAMNGNSPSDRRLTITSELLDTQYVQATVADTGPGFAPEVMERIFEPFRTTKPHGLGLGLPICRSIIRTHGGKLCVGNGNERGATVRFTLCIEEPYARSK